MRLRNVGRLRTCWLEITAVESSEGSIDLQCCCQRPVSLLRVEL